MVWIDGSSNQQASRAGVLLLLPKGDTVECVIRLQFSTTYNEVEYEAVLLTFDLAKVAGVVLAVTHCDSQVMVGHIKRGADEKISEHGQKLDE